MVAHLRSLLHEFNAAWRLINRRSSLSSIIVLCFALGIGANALLLDTIETLFFRQPPGVDRPNQVVRVVDCYRGRCEGRMEQDYLFYKAARVGNAGHLTAIGGFTDPVRLKINGEDAIATFVTEGFYRTLGARFLVGRGIEEPDDRPDATPTAVLAYDFWRARFGADPTILGRTIVVGAVPAKVIGIAQPGFLGVDDQSVDLWLPFSIFAPTYLMSGRATLTEARTPWTFIIARLRSVSERGAAEGALTTTYREYWADHGWSDTTTQIRFAPLTKARGPIPGQEVKITLLLAGMSIIVLTIACINAAMLLLVNVVRRQSELGVHLALGATPGSLFRQSLFEALILALVGCGLAFGVFVVVGPKVDALLLVSAAPPASLPRLRLFWIAGGAALLAGALASIAPGLLARRFGAWHLLAWRGSHRRQPIGKIGLALVLLQTGLSTTLLLGTFAFALSLYQLHRLDIGIRPANVYAIDTPPDYERTEGGNAGLALAEMANALRNTQGVSGVALTRGAPLLDAPSIGISRRLDEQEPQDPTVATFGAVSPDYFAALGTPIRQGRTFTAGDNNGATQVVIISENLANALWPDGNALAHCLRVNIEDGCRDIVGIAADAPMQSVLDVPPRRVYIPLSQDDIYGSPNHLLVRLDSTNPLPTVTLRARLAHATTAPFQITSLQDLVTPQFRPWELASAVLGIYALVALALSLVGLYSVLSHWTQGRLREFGVRMALGATRSGIVTTVLQLGVVTSLSGAILGSLGWWAISKAVAPLLFRTSAFDPLLGASALLVVIFIALMATLRPAWRAAGVNPAEVLRAE